MQVQLEKILKLKCVCCTRGVPRRAVHGQGGRLQHGHHHVGGRLTHREQGLRAAICRVPPDHFPIPDRDSNGQEQSPPDHPPRHPRLRDHPHRAGVGEGSRAAAVGAGDAGSGAWADEGVRWEQGGLGQPAQGHRWRRSCMNADSDEL